MCKKLLVVSAFFVWAVSSMAQSVSPAQNISREKLKSKVEAMSPEEGDAYFRKNQPRVPSQERMEAIYNQTKSVSAGVNEKKSTQALTMPNDMWYPGEWEEVQAIVVTWPYISVMKNNQSSQADPMLEHLGFDNNNNFDSIISYPYTPSSNTGYVKVFADLITGIQKGAQVWINLCQPEDTTIIKNYMNKVGQPLTNYRFFFSYVNSFWYRDCGPVAFYHGDKDSLAFLDFEYYPGRALDDMLPIKLGEQANIPVYTTSIETEGGNILVDGVGKFFSSDALYAANQDTQGQFYLTDPANKNSYAFKTKTSLTRQQVNDSINHLTNLTPMMLPKLRYDGGTGHIDLYADMWDESNFVFTKYPDQYSSWVDYTTARKNVDTITSLYTTYGTHFKKSYIPFPTMDNGNNFSSQSNYNSSYTRSYTNHTFVNNYILQPVFNNGTSGAVKPDSIAIQEIKKRYPGYEIIPIDVRSFDGSGGAIHCITKQIPAENPIRIMHNPVDADVTAFNNGYEIAATAINKRYGIKEVYCDWRVKSNNPNAPFTKTTLASQGNNVYKGTIGSTAQASDSLEYYIVATANNDKVMRKPITAPKGYYQIYKGKYYDYGLNRYTGISNVSSSNGFEVGNFFPNPATNQARIEISNPQMKQFDVQIFNNLGQLTYTTSINERSENMVFEINTTSFAKGFYSVIFSNGTEKVTKKLIVE